MLVMGSGASVVGRGGRQLKLQVNRHRTVHISNSIKFQRNAAANHIVIRTLNLPFTTC